MSRLPIRLRVTLVFSAVMAVVLAGTGLFLYLRLESQLNRDIDQDLHSRAAQLTALVQASDRGLGESVRSVLRQRDSFAQIVTQSGRLFDAKQQRGRAVLTAAELEQARRGAVSSSALVCPASATSRFAWRRGRSGKRRGAG